MSTTMTQSARDVVWDLSPLYSGLDDHALRRDREEVTRLVAGFQAHRGRVRSVDASALGLMIAELESIETLIERVDAFGFLQACTHEHDADRVAMREAIDEQVSRWRAELLFFDIELKQLGAKRLDELGASPPLAPWRHWLARKASMASLALSEPQEQVVVKKNIAGRDAIVRFREEFAARLDFGELEFDGTKQQVTEEILRSLGEHPDPDVRLAATNRMLDVYRANEEVFGFLYRCVVKDRGIETELRGARHPIDLENIPNEVPEQVVRALVEATRRHLPAIHDYYAWKGRVLGLARMRTCDRLAQPVLEAPERVEWEAGCRVVEEAFSAFDPALARLARRVVDERRIDASVRQGKRGGGFCMPVATKDCWILVNYTDTVDSVFTLAHELGHAVHFMLGSQVQRPFQAHAHSKVTAETASEFAECLLIDHLERSSADEKLLAHVLAHACQAFAGVVFRQVMFTEFELAAHERAREAPLQNEFMRDAWSRLCGDYYGPDVELAGDEAWGYAGVPHFVFNPFYCYSYALSQVSVLALYERYTTDRSGFPTSYVELLRAGGSASASDLLARTGVDLTDASTLEGAFQTFSARFARLRELIGDQAP